jgi:uncharacterized phage protein (TIGR02220 family)
MGQTAELFEIDNIKRFRNFWGKCSPHEQAEILKIAKQEMGEEVEVSLTKKELDAQADSVIEFLNQKTGKRYRPVDAHKKHIRARLQSGITVQELKAIVAMKVRDWKGTDQEQYLRPATLFCLENCENYLGALS